MHMQTPRFPGFLRRIGSACCALVVGLGSVTAQTTPAAPTITSAAATNFTVNTAGTFTATASGSPAPTFNVQAGTFPSWAALNAATGVISGTPTNTTGSPFNFTIRATNGVNPAADQNFALTVNTSAPRSLVSMTAQARDVVPLGGIAAYFRVEGTANKSILIRGIGPTLTALGGTVGMADPRLELFSSSGQKIAENDNWSADGELSKTSAFSLVGAVALPGGSKDSALLVNLVPGFYSVRLSAVVGTVTGAGRIEIYDAGVSSSASRLTYLAMRGITFLNVRFVLGGAGTGPTPIVFRAMVDPSLAESVSRTNLKLENYGDSPSFSLFNFSTFSQGGRDNAETDAIAARFGAIPFTAGKQGPSHSSTLNSPGNAVTADVAVGPGVLALAEVFDSSVGGAAFAPFLYSAPSDLAVIAGLTASFSVTAGGTGAINYQWRRNGTPISGATSTSYSFTAAVADAGSYDVMISNSVGTIISVSASLGVTAATPAVITSATGPATIVAGNDAVFSVAATSTTPLTYQWRKNGVSISGATSGTLTLTNVQSTDAGSYSVVVTNLAGNTTGTPATLTVTVRAAISTQPISQSIIAGSTTTFTVAATGTSPLTYQWRKDGTPILGATNATLTLSSLQSSDAGSYTVAVGNVAGSTTSNAAALMVINVPPAINTQPIGQTGIVGSPSTFTVVATGTAPFTYQWRKNGVSISGATNGSLTLPSVQPTDAGIYTVVVGNLIGNTTSNPATLTVNVPATISTQPISQTANAGTTATFTAAATGPAPLSYQWRKDGTPITGATKPTFTLSTVQTSDAASYTVVVANSAGSSTSNVANLEVTIPNPGRLINLSVLTDIAAAGDDFTLGYVVGGDNTLGAKPLIIRAAGPSLGALGVPGTLDDPKLELFAGSASIGGNDNWGGSPQFTAALAAVGAFAYTGPFSKDAATTASISTRDNSVKVSAVGSGIGKVIAEIYDATSPASFTTATPRLINLSVRKNLGSGLTMGFVVGGATPAKVLVRGIGPTLSAFGVPGTVADPQLTLFNSSSVKIGENNDWAGTAELIAVFASVGAFTLPANSKDAALRVTLQPGNYTVQVTGVNGTTGVALVEVYEVP